MGGRDAINCTLEDWIEVFFKIGMGDLGRRCGGSSGAGRVVGGDGEVCEDGGRCVYGGIYGGIYGCGHGGVRLDARLGLVDLVWIDWKI